MATTKKSGSEKLSAKGGAKDPGTLAKILAQLKASRIKNDILTKGTPLPDTIKGTFVVKTASQAGTALEIILGARGVTYKPVQLFPKGIPVINEIVGQIDGKIVK